MDKTKIIYIENANVKLGVLVEIGGTVGFLSKNGSENLLKCDSDLWDNSQKPIVNAQADFMPYNGHTIWVGPQSDWWSQQSVNTERKNQKAVWPPDPYISYGEYKILHQTENSIKIQSPESPVSRIQIEKEFAINPDGSIFQQVRFYNFSSKPVNWDIWFNTRIDGFNKAYINAEEKNCRVEHVLNQNSTDMPFKISDNIFYYEPVNPPAEFNERSSKTFIFPIKPSIFAFTKNFLLRIDFELHKQSEIHPEQGHIEIYNHTEHNNLNNLLELEYHAPYNTINPGEYTEAWQVWEIESYSGANTSNEHITYLKNKIK